MSTRSIIGIAQKNDTINYIYCHFDGYVKDGVGEALLENFSNTKSVLKLLSNGDIRSILQDSTVQHYPDPDIEIRNIDNDEFAPGVMGAEFVYLWHPEAKTWIYKDYDSASDDATGVSDWKLLVV